MISHRFSVAGSVALRMAQLVHGPQTMNTNNFGDALTFHLAPP